MKQNLINTEINAFGRTTEQALSVISPKHPYTAGSPVEIKQSLNAYRADLKKLHTTIEGKHLNQASGQLICGMLSIMIDSLIKHFYRLLLPESIKEPGFAIISLGGYGRRELNPYSDIDLLFLTQKTPDESENGIIMPLVQFLWDMNYDLGQSIRTIDESIEAAGDDSYLATSMLDARFLEGNPKIWNQFRDSHSQWLHGGAGKQLALRKIEDRFKRLEYFHDTVQIQEPNIKECPGTLRDIHTVRWLLLLTRQGKNLTDLTQSGLLSESEAVAYEDDLEFLLRARNTLHFYAGKKSDVIDHVSLPEIAKNLHYSGEGIKPAEKFMHEYYMRTARVKRLSDRIVDEFLDSFSPGKADTFTSISKEFTSNGKQLALNNEQIESLSLNPRLFVEIFAVAGSRGLDLTHKTASIITRNLIQSSKNLPKFSEVKSAFHNLINMRSGVSRALRLMHDHGVLTKLIPEFETICWHYQYDFYHTFTTDEHSLRVVENLEVMFQGNVFRDQGLFNLMQDVTAKGALYLAGLLHDIGKGVGILHSQRGERMASRALKRLGFDERTIQLVRFLTHEHLLMSHLSQRRDLDEEDTINDLLKHVKSTGRLRMLTLLTFADLMALSANALTDWKRALIWDLYDRTLLRIEKGFESAVHSSTDDRVKRVTDKLRKSLPEQAIVTHLASLPEQYIRDTASSVIKRHIQGIEIMKKRGAWSSFQHKGEVSALTVIAPDHPSALSDICGTITSSDINIVWAQILTRTDGIIIDTFLVVNKNDGPLIPAETQDEFKHNIRSVISGKSDVNSLIQGHVRRWKRRKKQQVVYSPPRVKVHNDISPKHTIIDIFANDYTGLLYDITSLLAAHGIDIHTARIGTDEDQVADAFYIRKDGKKIEDDEEINKLSAEIIGRLGKASDLP